MHCIQALIPTSQGILPKAPPANSTLPKPGGRKSASHWGIRLSGAVECTGAFRRMRGPLILRPRPPYPPKTYIPSATSHHTDVCPLRAAGAVPLGDSWLQRLAWRKWPRCFETTSKALTWNRCAKSNHDSGSTKLELATCPQVTQILDFPASSPPIGRQDGLRCNHKQKDKTVKTCQDCENQIWGGKLASLPCLCISEAVCKVSMDVELRFTDLGRRKCDVQFTF